MADGGIGTSEDEGVGHAGAGKRDVGFGFIGPLRGETGVVGEVGDLADVEASCADDDVDWVEDAVCGVDAIGVDAGDGLLVRWTLGRVKASR
jgi:hypothetical protein